MNCSAALFQASVIHQSILNGARWDDFALTEDKLIDSRPHWDPDSAV